MESPSLLVSFFEQENMKLSDLHTGEIAVIAKVGGHGGFR